MEQALEDGLLSFLSLVRTKGRILYLENISKNNIGTQFGQYLRKIILIYNIINSTNLLILMVKHAAIVA